MIGKSKKKMDDDIVDLKSVSGKYNINEDDSSSYKNYIIIFLVVFLIISLFFNIYFFQNSQNDNTSVSQSKIIHYNKKNISSIISHTKTDLSFNTYNIHMDNIEDFYSSENLILLPGNNCPNHNIKTFFFKPVYPLIKSEYTKYQVKNFSLRLRNESENVPSVYSSESDEIREVFLKRLGMKLNSKMSVDNLYMTTYSIYRKFKKNINNVVNNKYQKINRFYNYNEYVSKSLLYINYKPFHDKFPDDYNYMLETYSYPKEKQEIIEKFSKYSLKNDNDVWMIKPIMGSLGLKISILTNYSDIKLKNYLITKYLYNPHLIKGYKYDLRFHGLVSTIKPLKLYLYNEGLVRLASEKYNFSVSDPHNKYSFLTNLFINKKNKKKFIYPKNMKNMEDSNLWNLDTFQKYCARNNINYEKLYSEVGDIFIKMMITVREKIIDNIEKTNLQYSNFYHLIGFDIILDENLKPYLLETNRRCGFRNDNDAEKYYTYNIIADTLNIIGLRPKDLNFVSENKNKEDLIKENVEESLCELDRPRGGYKLIFPLKDNVDKYKKFFGENISEEDQELWKRLIE